MAEIRSLDSIYTMCFSRVLGNSGVGRRSASRRAYAVSWHCTYPRAKVPSIPDGGYSGVLGSKPTHPYICTYHKPSMGPSLRPGIEWMPCRCAMIDLPYHPYHPYHPYLTLHVHLPVSMLYICSTLPARYFRSIFRRSCRGVIGV